jgi:pantothenate kinase-related protein Tda10
VQGEWEALMYEYVNNKLAQYPDIHKKIEDELLEMRSVFI